MGSSLNILAVDILAIKDTIAIYIETLKWQLHYLKMIM